MPAAPTRAEIESAWRSAISLFDQTYRYGSRNATNFLGLLDTLEQGLEGEFVDEATAAAQAMRSQLAGMVTRAAAQALFRPFLKMYCRHVIGRGDLSSDESMLSELYKYFIDNSLRVQSRVFTYGTPAAAAANVGTTQIVRLTRDRYNFPIESGHIDSKRARCVLDHNSGTQKGNETWFLEGNTVPRDDLYRSGSGAFATLSGQTPDDSLLGNADFRSFGNTAAAPDDIPDWTSSVAVSSTNYLFDNLVSNVYRVAPSNALSTSYSLAIKATARLSQKLTVRGSELDQDLPYLFAVIWNRAIAAASGTLVLRMGNVQNSITVSAQTGWQVSFAPPLAGWSNWYRVFAEDDLECDIDWTRTGGDLYVAEALLLPGTFFDGSYYWILPSSAAAYIAPRVLDEFTYPDIATDAVIQRSLAFAWQGFYLPSANGSSITWAEP